MSTKQTPKKKETKKTGDVIKAVHEQLGLYLYPEKEKKVSVLEVEKSEHPKVSKFNDIDLNKWKEYDDIITDSLWLIGSRDRSGVHTAELHGNFIPQIPHQAMLRYTKRKEIVLDTSKKQERKRIEKNYGGEYG